MKTETIIEILHSIKDVRLDSVGELQVKFNNSDPAFPDGWEPIVGYAHGSFTEQLLLLIEEALQGKLPTAANPSPNGEQATY
jgi:hypothetical protein